ncbi:MAG: hypothetical protein L6R40_003938 [Gallowayella cf. fulva]|nr:MAG: hypothetical protein L6R40_003938 [Xanthomendoza cf. fulva]
MNEDQIINGEAGKPRRPPRTPAAFTGQYTQPAQVALQEHDDDGPNNNGQVKSDACATLSPASLTSSQPFHTSSIPPTSAPGLLDSASEDDEPATATCFERSTSPVSVLQRNKGAEYRKVGEEGVCKIHRFSLYETVSWFYLVGGDVLDCKFRILKIDRTADSGDLSVVEDEIVYTRKEMNQLLNAVDDGNKASGGLRMRCSCWGVLGFIRFTGAYYMLVITKRSQVAMIGGHYVYQIDGTELVSLTSSSSSRPKADRMPEEARFVSTLSNLDLSRSFYFSYTYDITRSLQLNMIQEREALGRGLLRKSQDYQDGMFVWNQHLLGPASVALQNTYDWCIPIIHGFVDQTNISIHARTVSITVIARRSRFFAGARYLKRGANDLGYVANDVETEQIVSEALTTSFHAPGPQLYASPNFTSYVQHRGSIPLHWTQDNSGVTPKPDIELNLVDPFFTAAALHFDNLFERYGAPIYVLNLIKARERIPRESILLKEYTNAITYLNQSLPEDKKIVYKAWDMSRASKSRDQDVIGTLESLAKDIVSRTGFFRSGDAVFWKSSTQNGVARTNCIDCLDRTNAAQFIIGKCALGHQLEALGITTNAAVEFDSDVVTVLSHMYHAHGDMIAIQYGGSHLVNTMATYRKINQWSSQSRDMVESFKRYYNNSFLDRQRQEAYNLFLGNYIFVQGQPMLWDLATDYYLHHADPRAWSPGKRKNYIKWFDPRHLEERRMPQEVHPTGALANKPLHFFDDYWREYYRPTNISAFPKILSYKVNSLRKYPPPKESLDGGAEAIDPQSSLAAANKNNQQDNGRPKSDLSYVDTPTAANQDYAVKTSRYDEKQSGTALSDWLRQPAQPPRPEPNNPVSIERDLQSERKADKPPKDKSAATQWTLNQFVANSLNPTVIESEADEYLRYINHPSNLPLVVSTDDPPHPNADFLGYIQSNSPDAAANMLSTEDDIADFEEFLNVGDDPLTVTDADTPKKRYKAYRQWLKGRSLFKQQRVDV